MQKVPDSSGAPILAALCHVLSEEDPSGQCSNISLRIGGILLADDLPCWLPIGGGETPAGFLLVEKVPDGSGEPVLAAFGHVLSEKDPSGQRTNISLGIGCNLPTFRTHHV